MKKISLIGILAGVLVFAGIAGAAMMDLGTGGTGTMIFGGMGMTNSGGFGRRMAWRERRLWATTGQHILWVLTLRPLQAHLQAAAFFI